VKSSAPTWLVVFYTKNYIMILIMTLITYVVMGYALVTLDLMHMTNMEPNQFFLTSAETTQQLDVFIQL